MPAIFAAHGAPILPDDAVWVGQLAAWATAIGPLPNDPSNSTDRGPF
jgi:hypothetical protein